MLAQDTATHIVNRTLPPETAIKAPSVYGLALRTSRALWKAMTERKIAALPLLDPSDAPSLDLIVDGQGNRSRASATDFLCMYVVTVQRVARTVAMLAAIREAMVPRPGLVRVVSSAGRWWSLAREEHGERVTLHMPSGAGFTLSMPDDGPDELVGFDGPPAHPWGWDGRTDARAVERWWPIVYVPPSTPEAQRETVVAVLGTARAFAPADVEVPVVIVTASPESFNPTTPGPYPAPDMPDGQWEHHGKTVREGNKAKRVRARPAFALYWRN